MNRKGRETQPHDGYMGRDASSVGACKQARLCGWWVAAGQCGGEKAVAPAIEGPLADVDLGVESSVGAGPCVPPAGLRRAWLPVHLLVEQLLGLGLRQGVPVRWGVRATAVPPRRSACRRNRWWLSRHANRGENPLGWGGLGDEGDAAQNVGIGRDHSSLQF